jgi:DNA polymerase (family 10)
VENAQIASLLSEIADLIELEGGNEFRVRSYRSAARTVKGYSHRLEDLAEENEDLAEIPSIGESTAAKLHEILETGTCKRLEQLRERVPEGLTQVMRVPQVGPRTAMQLYRELGVSNLEELRAAAENRRIRELDGMGERSEQTILRGIETLEASAGRVLYADAADHVTTIGRHLEAIDAIATWEVAGSFRRCKETVGDLDILVRADDREAAADGILELGGVDEVIGRGEERISVRMSDGLQIDFRFFEEAALGAALMYFTGSKAHNIALRQLAVERQWKLNEYGLFKGDNRLGGRDEASVYHRLDLDWVPPELREDRGEVAAAQSGELPDLITLDQIRGDLQSHSTASDGTASVREMAEAAAERGYQFFAITDHSKRVTMANGLDDEAALEHADRVREVNADLDDLWLMAGIEVDVLKDGSLDLKEATLRQLDWVVASIHYDLGLEEKAMTERLLAAIRSGVVHCLGHPTGRIIGHREPIAFDLDAVLEACVEHDVCVEINAQPDRLDLADLHCQRALEAGVTFTIGTDAHKPADLDLMRYGVNVARRGWLGRESVLNTRTASQLRRRLGKE